jgi:hypothetical protein
VVDCLAKNGIRVAGPTSHSAILFAYAVARDEAGVRAAYRRMMVCMVRALAAWALGGRPFPGIAAG